MNILVYGVGGVGGFIGSQILNSDFDVTFIARGERYKSLKKYGLSLKSKLGNKSIKKIKVYERIPKTNFDIIISTVKLYDFDHFVSELNNLDNLDNKIILPFQNGIYSEQKIIEELGIDNSYGAVAQISSYIGANQEVIHKGDLATFFVGNMNNKTDEKLSSFCEKSKNTGLDIRQKNNIKEKIWEKFIFLSAYSGITTLTKKTIGEIFDTSRLKEDFIKAMIETFELSKFFLVKFSYDPVEFWLEKIRKMPYDMTSSMFVDYKNNRRLELKWLSGFIVKYSNKFGHQCPIHKKILNGIKTI